MWSKEIEILNALSNGGDEVDEEVLVQQVKEAIKSVEKSGWGAKGKTKKDKPVAGRKKRKRKGDEDSEDDSDGDDE